jgi:hypothetical protein
MGLRNDMLDCLARGAWDEAGERFADYWGGSGTWAATSAERRAAFIAALKPVPHEWEAVLGEQTTLATWSQELPEQTLVVHDPATRRPIREIVELLQGAANWRFEKLSAGGHMAPLSRAELVNPIVERFLKQGRSG